MSVVYFLLKFQTKVDNHVLGKHMLVRYSFYWNKSQTLLYFLTCQSCYFYPVIFFTDGLMTFLMMLINKLKRRVGRWYLRPNLALPKYVFLLPYNHRVASWNTIPEILCRTLHWFTKSYLCFAVSLAFVSIPNFYLYHIVFSTQAHCASLLFYLLTQS